MYGQTGGAAAVPLALMRRRFPKATALLDDAAREGERGRLVRSRLGRTCPPPSQRWHSAVAGDVEADAAADDNRRSGQIARARGRFTRNFVIQATAAEWAEVLLALLRRRLRTLEGPQLVFFQHDEVLVHAPREHAPAVAEMIGHSAADAGRLVFGRTPVRFPMSVHSVECYGDAK
jgi:DNA polymerase-1